jgi:predicted PurR-regulated permease PerM
VALYGGVDFVEGNLIAPLVQREAVELPPVLTFFAALVCGVLLGPWTPWRRRSLSWSRSR